MQNGVTYCGLRLTSVSFVEKAALLLLTVILSGIAVPLAVNWLNANDAERKKVLEIAKAKEDANIGARHALLNEFSDVLLTYETLALDVSWYRQVSNACLYEARYSANANASQKSSGHGVGRATHHKRVHVGRGKSAHFGSGHRHGANP